jgi:hypothetical protein
MAPQTGRTTSKWIQFYIDDSSSNLREIAVNSISAVGVIYEEHDLTAFTDAVKGALPGMPDAPLEFGGPVDTTATTGSHTVLAGVLGGNTPLTIDVRFGSRHAWEAGEVQFGITATATVGYLITSYTIDPSSMMYSAKAVLFPGSTLPAFGTTAET